MDVINETPALDTGYYPDLSPEQVRAVNHIRARRMMRTEDTINMESFGTDAIDGYVPNVVRGALGLKKETRNSMAV